MRCMDRNKQDFYYALHTGSEPIRDEWGNLTGEYKVKYAEPIKARGNISANKGSVDIQLFGTELVYSRTIAIDNYLPIDENTVLWVDRDITDTYNYVVKSVAKSLNNTLLAIERVDVS